MKIDFITIFITSWENCHVDNEKAANYSNFDSAGFCAASIRANKQKGTYTGGIR
jgi:hypothetical protein